VNLTSHDADPAGRLLRIIRPLYAEIYAEGPYCEGPAGVAEFEQQWDSRTVQPGFRVVIAHAAVDEEIGFAFGHRLVTNTKWWGGMLDPVPEGTTQETPSRTFAVIEVAVRSAHRRHGIGNALHHELLVGREEQRVTLLCRPEATAARAAYTAWGYRDLGRLQPFPDAPIYIAMVRDLPL
jgi:ribosomal protein S18 acetylase RimI-like enzyme